MSTSPRANAARYKESRYNIWQRAGGRWFVFNGASGALLSLSERDRAAMEGLLAGGAEEACPPKLLEALVLGLMLLPADFDEVERLRQVYRASSGSDDHLSLTIVPSLGCNFDCPYCFENKTPSVMTPRVESAICAFVASRVKALGALHVTWFGGEPLVGKRSLLRLSDRLIALCDAQGTHYSAEIVTNGYLLDAASCAELAARHVSRAQVTIDGPPDVHDRMRPLAGGGGSFEGIVANLARAAELLEVTLRINVDRANLPRAEELLAILAARGLAGKLAVYLGHLLDASTDPAAPSASYCGRCLSKPDFAEAEMAFRALAERYGFGGRSLPRPLGTPCTAVRKHDLVIGSRGELYKCWESIGNPAEVTGSILDYRRPGTRVHKWLSYDPFENPECRACVALPVCMGGCANHALIPGHEADRCGTFRFTHRQQVARFVEAAAARPRERQPDAPGVARGAQRATA